MSLGKSAHIDAQSSARRVLHGAALAQQVQRGGDSFASRHHHLRELVLRQIGSNLDELAVRLTELVGERAQRLYQPLHDVVVRQAVELVVGLGESAAIASWNVTDTRSARSMTTARSRRTGSNAQSSPTTSPSLRTS